MILVGPHNEECHQNMGPVDGFILFIGLELIVGNIVEEEEVIVIDG